LPEESHILEHIVQMDEAYFKGMVVLMEKQKGTRKLSYEIIFVTSVQRHHVGYFLFCKIKPGAQLWTDGAAIYKSIDKW
jgi:hypothetical protein